MSRGIRGILICPMCSSSLYGESLLICKQCGKQYPVRNGIPRFVENDGYASSFSWEWRKHSGTLVDSLSGKGLSKEMFLERTGLAESDIQGKLVLDAGCGTGRFLEVIREFGGEGVGIDLSYSVDEARKNLGGDANLVQGDLMRLPFQPRSFDVVFSIGVIHHTPNARQAFRNLAGLVKPGGILAVWVYSNEGLFQKVYNAVSGGLRLVSTRLPSGVLYRLCYASIPLYYIHRLTWHWSLMLVPISMNSDATVRLLDTFDWYSPKYQSKHTRAELRSWCLENGLALTRLPFPVSLRAVKL